MKKMKIRNVAFSNPVKDSTTASGVLLGWVNRASDLKANPPAQYNTAS